MPWLACWFPIRHDNDGDKVKPIRGTKDGLTWHDDDDDYREWYAFPIQGHKLHSSGSIVKGGLDVRRCVSVCVSHIVVTSSPVVTLNCSFCFRCSLGMARKLQVINAVDVDAIQASDSSLRS